MALSKEEFYNLEAERKLQPKESLADRLEEAIDANLRRGLLIIHSHLFIKGEIQEEIKSRFQKVGWQDVLFDIDSSYSTIIKLLL